MRKRKEAFLDSRKGAFVVLARDNDEQVIGNSGLEHKKSELYEFTQNINQMFFFVTDDFNEPCELYIL
jgi:hypothetical protein